MATLITGATGFVGKHLLPLIEAPIVTSRNRSRALKRLGDSVQDVVEWDPAAGPIQLDPKLKIDCVINLMGESIAEGRWTDAKKKRIRDSRVLGTQNLIKGLQQLNELPKSFLSASAVGIYGSQADHTIDESNTSGSGYLVDLCREWEEAAMTIASDQVRVALIRIGIVLGKGGGAIEAMLPIFKWGLGGRLGNGKQFVPWIHVHDLAKMFVWAMNNPDVSGPVNGSAPNPVTNQDFTKAIAKAVRRVAILPAPAFALRIALGEFADSLLASQRVIPKVALDGGFEFEFNEIDAALANID